MGVAGLFEGGFKQVVAGAISQLFQQTILNGTSILRQSKFFSQFVELRLTHLKLGLRP